jgi:CRISPR-associated protein Cmr2
MSKSELKRIVDKPRKALRALLQEIGHREPTPYYAMLLADGDRMGVVIDSLSDAGRHARLSERLDLFARGTKEIVEAHSGSLIYAGGDDVLALVPLHRAVPCAQALAKSFNEKLAEFTTKHDGQDVPTLSVGVAIAHHLAHFADVRVQAKQAERLAKTKRNALAVIIDKRSGGERSFVGGWDVVQRLEDWQRLIADGDISHGFLREVEDLARFTRPGLARHAAPSPEDLRQLLQHELERIMARKQPGMRGNAGLDADIQARIRETLDTYSGREEEQMDVGKAISQLGSELYVALEIHRVQQLTKPPEEKAA